MKRVVLGGLFAVAFAALAVGLSGQAGADLELQLEPGSLARGRTSILTVSIRIPAGRFIPAETRGPLRGAWVQTTTSGLFERELPTYPIPAEVRLPRTDRPMLAYSGTVLVRVPVETGAGMRGPHAVEMRVAYQLCDPIRCDAFRTRTVRRTIAIDEPAPPETTLALRADAGRVAILTSERVSNEPSIPQRTIPARFGGRLANLPDGHPGIAKLTDTIGIGSEWIIRSSRASFHATAERPSALVSSACPDDMPLAMVARVQSPGFAGERAKYFLADPRGSMPHGPARRIVLAPVLTDDQRRALEGVIDRQMRITVPTLLAPDPHASAAARQPRETAYDRRIRAGEGRLVYHLEAFRLAPDDATRLFVRAHWALNGQARTGLTLWIRFDGRTFVVERSNASVSRYAQFDEMFTANVAENAATAGLLLSVVPAADGWAYMILAHVGYESRAVTVWKYSPHGPLDTGIVLASGC
jgi:hypothetical protein